MLYCSWVLVIFLLGFNRWCKAEVDSNLTIRKEEINRFNSYSDHKNIFFLKIITRISKTPKDFNSYSWYIIFQNIINSETYHNNIRYDVTYVTQLLSQKNTNLSFIKERKKKTYVKKTTLHIQKSWLINIPK